MTESPRDRRCGTGPGGRLHARGSVGIAASLLALGLGGCDRDFLIPAPHVMHGEHGRAVYERVPESRRRGDIPLLFFTNRAVQRRGEHGDEFNAGRVDTISYGTVVVGLPQRAGWDELDDGGWSRLVELSTTPGSRASPALGVTDKRVAGTLPSVFDGARVDGPRIVRSPDAMAASEAADRDVTRMIASLASSSGDDRVLLYVHGFSDGFDKSAVRFAQLWHFTGRRGIPVLFTWPSRSDVHYLKDRESGEFSVPHLRRVLRLLAASPAIKRIDIVAHSRGADLVVSAIRDITMGERRGGADRLPPAAAATHDPRGPVLAKISTVILAAPDLDLDIFRQRFVAENLVASTDRWVIYTSRHDHAFILGDVYLGRRGFFGGRSRSLGALQPGELADLNPDVARLIADLPSVEIIHCDVRAADRHAYVFEHPAVVSDVYRVLAMDIPAGERGRPLTPPASNEAIWTLGDTYLLPPDRGPGPEKTAHIR